MKEVHFWASFILIFYKEIFQSDPLKTQKPINF